MQEHVQRVFPSATVTDAHDDMLSFQLSQDDASPRKTAWDNAGEGAGVNAGRTGGRIARVFAAMVEMRDMADDFAVSQTTLEQVFLKLAKERDAASRS